MGNSDLSVHLDPDNLLWLKSQARASGHESLSRTLNAILTRIRTKTRAKAGSGSILEARAVISEEDPDLKDADAAIRELFRRSVERSAETLGTPSREPT